MKTKKILCNLMALVTLGSVCALAACGGMQGGVNEKVDETRTQLYIGNYNGGYGDAWLKAAKVRFELAYKEVPFETGKTGVQIIIDNKKEEYKDFTNLSNTIEKSKNAVYFTEGIDYKQLIDAGYMLDMSEILDTPLTEYGEEESIYDKMEATQKAYYVRDEKCYALPTYNAFFGLIYDVDLFEDYGLYFAAEADNGNDGFVLSKTDAKSNGPDGVPSYDDGLPATYEEFFKLCDRMQDAGITPFIWSGEYESSYIRQLAGALWADYEGKDAALNFYDLTGSIEVVDSLDAQGNVSLKTVDITTENGYEIYAQAGRYYSVKFIETMVKGGATERYWQNRCFNLTQSHTNAQEDYLYSKYETGSKPIAMLADGCWWQSEADLAFSDVADAYGEQASKENRRFGFMPMPKATEAQVGEGVTLLDALNAKVFINANVSNNPVQKDLAFKFIRFMHTDQSLSEFQGITNVPKAMNYQVLPEDEAKLTYFGKCLNQMKTNSDIVYEYPLTSAVELMPNVGVSLNAYMTTINSLPYSAVAKTFKDNPAFTAKQYFEGMKSFYKANWSKYGG